jgi:hypothetical protein
MSNNFDGTDHAGAPVPLASHEVAGVHHPLTKMVFGPDGAAQVITADNPLPASDAEAVVLLETIAQLLSALSNNIGALSPDAAGRLRVAAETVANIATITTVTTVTTVTTLSNQTNIGGVPANQQIGILNLLGEEQLRRNIVIS